jgi:hypothetical protein
VSAVDQPFLHRHEWRFVLTWLVALGPIGLVAGVGVGVVVDLPRPGAPARFIPSIGTPGTTTAPSIITVTAPVTPRPTPRSSAPRPTQAPRPVVAPNSTPTPTPTVSVTTTPSPTTTPEVTPSTTTSTSPSVADPADNQQQAGDHLP